MNRQFDDITLSAYVDGELDPSTMREVEAFLEVDTNAQKYVMNAVKTTARLRVFANEALVEAVPERLISAIGSWQKYEKDRRPALRALFRMAAAVLLILLGFGAGSLILPTGDRQFTAITSPFPASYSSVVDEALEHNLSGNSRQWQAPSDSLTITVTPVRTYRDKNGRYFREYQLEVVSETERRKINGLAYREEGKWKTKAVFYQ
jgi:hypothetical protein